MQSDTLEERYAIKFCFKLGKNPTETYGMLQTAFQPSCMNRTSVFEWYKRFKEARESVRDDITLHSPDDGSAEPKRYSVDFVSQ